MLSYVVLLSIIAANVGALNPVIMIPGDGGSRLEAKLNKTDTVHYICEKSTSDYFTLWLNIEEFVKVVIDCWVDNAKLVYNSTTRKSSNQPGVVTRVPGWGDTVTVEWLDPLKLPTGTYFKDIGNALVANGYERGKSLRGAPYDFRKAPNENDEWFSNMKTLVEETYSLNDNSPVILLAHSMGAPMSHRFLVGQSQEWKDKYIHSVISLSGAWAGSFKSLKVFYMGDNLGVFILPQGTLKEAQITMPSIAWLLPWPSVWKPDEVLIQTQFRNYSLSNLKNFFLDIDNEIGWEMTRDQSRYWDFTPPGVNIHCLYGAGIPTAEKMVFANGQWPGGEPDLETGDGDGTVNMKSLMSCKNWNGYGNKNVTSKPYPGINHQGMLHETQVINDVLDIIFDKHIEWPDDHHWWDITV